MQTVTTSTICTTARTDFAQFSHQQLIAMLAASDPATVRAAAEQWDATGRLLHDQATALQHRLASFHEQWEGQAAQQYQRMISELAGALEVIANAAWAIRNATYDAADALDTARAQMPAALAVPQLPPHTITLATTPLTFDGLTQPQASQLIQQQAAALAAVKTQQQAQVAADSAHAQAVQVMTTLAAHYAADNASFPALPVASGSSATTAPVTTDPIAPPQHTMTSLVTGAVPTSVGAGTSGAVAGGGTATTTSGSATVDAATVTDPSVPDAFNSPLFGKMFSEGIAAAGGTFAVSKLFNRGRPDPVPPGFIPNDPAPATHAHVAGAHHAGADAAAAAAAALRHAAAHSGAGLGALGGGGGGGVGGLGAVATSLNAAAAAPTAYAGFAAGMAGATPTSAFSAASGAVAGAGAGASTSAGGFMGGMPMGAGMAGMGADGGGRRLPPWLVETEDVWGESSAVSPTVIGEER